MTMATSSNADQAVAAYAEGSAEYKKGSFAEAIKRFKTAVELDPKFHRAWAYLAMAHAAAAEIDQAIDAYRRCLEIEPGYHKACNNLGELYRRRGRLHHAVTVFKMAIEIDAMQAQYHYNLGITYADLEMLPYAEKALAMAQELDRRDIDYATELSQTRLRLGNAEGAAQALEKFLGVVPTHERAVELETRMRSLRRKAEEDRKTASGSP